MIDDRPTFRERKTVLRIAAVPKESVTLERRLLERGIDPESIPDMVDALGGKTVFSTEEVVKYVFHPRENESTPYKVSRFSDGTIGVYYSALDECTCKAELGFHLCAEIFDTDPRFYSLIECSYEGATKDLRGLETKYPDLVSPTQAGYPFCQELGKRASAEGIDGYFTTSARHSEGTCVPVFKRTALSEPRIAQHYHATVRSGEVTFNLA